MTTLQSTTILPSMLAQPAPDPVGYDCPQRAAPTVAAEVHSPLSFGVSAHGGTWQDQAAAIIEAMRDLRAAGLIGPDARVESEDA